MPKVSGRVLAAAAVAAIAIGAGVGAAVASFGNVEYEAQASVRISAKGGAATVTPLLPTLRELATSSVLAGDVKSTLRLPGSAESLRKRIHATTPSHTQLITVSFTDRNRTRAEQIAQEIAVKLTELVPARFGTTIRGLKAALFDQAHVVSRSAPDYVGDALIGAAIGLVLALAGIAATMRRAGGPVPTGADGALAEREERLEQRIAAVTVRESSRSESAPSRPASAGLDLSPFPPSLSRRRHRHRLRNPFAPRSRGRPGRRWATSSGSSARMPTAPRIRPRS
jgi:capsular polysaccharide biosynthesis protein